MIFFWKVQTDLQDDSIFDYFPKLQKQNGAITFLQSNPIVPVGNVATSEIGDGIIPINQNYGCLQIVTERVGQYLKNNKSN